MIRRPPRSTLFPLHDALPISDRHGGCPGTHRELVGHELEFRQPTAEHHRSEEHTSELQSQSNLVCRLLLEKKKTTSHHARFALASTTTSYSSSYPTTGATA